MDVRVEDVCPCVPDATVRLLFGMLGTVLAVERTQPAETNSARSAQSYRVIYASVEDALRARALDGTPLGTTCLAVRIATPAESGPVTDARALEAAVRDKPAASHALLIRGPRGDAEAADACGGRGNIAAMSAVSPDAYVVDVRSSANIAPRVRTEPAWRRFLPADHGRQRSPSRDDIRHHARRDGRAQSPEGSRMRGREERARSPAGRQAERRGGYGRGRSPDDRRAEGRRGTGDWQSRPDERFADRRAISRDRRSRSPEHRSGGRRGSGDTSSRGSSGRSSRRSRTPPRDRR